MTDTDTIGRVARPRGALSAQQIERLHELRDLAAAARAAYRMQAVLAVEASSFSAVAEATGLSKDTLQRWKRELGK